MITWIITIVVIATVVLFASVAISEHKDRVDAKKRRAFMDSLGD